MLDDDGRAGGGLDVAPADPVLVEDVGLRASGSSGRSDGSWTSGAPGRERGRERDDGRQLLVLDAHEAGCLLSGIPRVGDHGGHRLAVVLRLADGEDGPSSALRPEAGHGLRQVGGRHARGGRRAAAARRSRRWPTIRARAHGHRHELGVQLVGQVDVGHVLLGAADPGDAADPVGRVADPGRAHRPALPVGIASGGRQDGLDDLLVAAAAAEVAGQALLDLGDRGLRVRRSRSSAAMSWPGMQKPHWTAPSSRNACWSGAQRAVRAPGPRPS